MLPEIAMVGLHVRYINLGTEPQLQSTRGFIDACKGAVRVRRMDCTGFVFIDLLEFLSSASDTYSWLLNTCKGTKHKRTNPQLW